MEPTCEVAAMAKENAPPRQAAKNTTPEKSSRKAKDMAAPLLDGTSPTISDTTRTPTSSCGSPCGSTKGERGSLSDDSKLERGDSNTANFVDRLDAVADVPEQPSALVLPPVYRMSFFIVLPAFAAYAALFTLQHEVKEFYGIQDNHSDASHDFSFATSFLYIFNLIFRVMHNVVFGCFKSRTRVYIAMGALMIAMLILAVVTAGLLAPRMEYVMLAYALGGVGVGSFESNLLSTLTFLGHGTKKYATSAIPIGIVLLQTSAFSMLQCGLPVQLIYVLVIAALFCGMTVLCFGIPVQEDEFPGVPSALQTRFQLLHDLRAWRNWLPRMWSLPFAMAVDMFSLSAFAPGVLLFVYDMPNVVLLSPPLVSAEFSISKDMFFVLYNFCTACGGVTGRISAYHVRRLVHPAWFIAFSVVGVTLVVLGFPGHALSACGPLIAFPAGVLIFLGDGFIYNTIGRTIDENVPRAYNLAAISCWFFVGDFGSVAGSNLIPYIRDWVS